MFYDNKIVIHDCYHGKPSPIYIIEGVSQKQCSSIRSTIRTIFDVNATEYAIYSHSFMNTYGWKFPYCLEEEFGIITPHDSQIIATEKVIHRAAEATTEIFNVAEMLHIEANKRIILDSNFFRVIIDALTVGIENIDWILQLNKYPLCAVIPTIIFFIDNDEIDSPNLDKIREWYSVYLSEMRAHTSVVTINGANSNDKIVADVMHEINKVEERLKNEQNS